MRDEHCWSLHVLTGDKGQGVPVHTMKTWRGRRGVAPLFPNLGAKYGLVVDITHLSLYILERTPKAVLDNLDKGNITDNKLTL